MKLAKRLLSTFTAVVLLSGFMASSTLYAYVSGVQDDLPDHTQLSSWSPKEGSRVLAVDGTVLAVHALENRRFISLSEVPPHVLQAFVSAEDRNFWEHSGLDTAGIARAFLANLRRQDGEGLEGGSTITQQVVKNTLLSNERTFERKVKEAILALRVDRDLGKHKVAEIYINDAYFGSGAYGVKAAASVFFGKEIGDLSIEEAALLAGLVKAPSSLNPYRNLEGSKQRRNYVLSRLHQDGHLSKSDLDRLIQTPVVLSSGVAASSITPSFWYPQEEARRKIMDTHGYETLYSGGLDITTTIDPYLQREAHRTLRSALVREDRKNGWRGPLKSGLNIPVSWSSIPLPDGIEDWRIGIVEAVGRDASVITENGVIELRGEDLSWATRANRADAILDQGDLIMIGDLGSGPELVQIPKTLQGALVALNPADGAILAMSGGFSHEISEFNRATQARRQMGSVFKPFVYASALEAGYDPDSPVLDSPISLSQGGHNPDWTPQGGRGGMGLISLTQSLSLSRNMSTVRLLYDIGLDPVMGMAERLGLSVVGEPNFAMALGAIEATPVQVAAAYAPFANGGYSVNPHLILPSTNAGYPALDDRVVSGMNTMLREVVSSGTARSAFVDFSGDFSGKTGTTNDSKDAWFVGYDPGLVVAVWIGRDDNRAVNGISGGKTAAPVVRDFMDRIEGRK